MKIKTVIFDLDGTLLDSKSRISEFTKETIEYLYSKGISFGAASGRPISEIERKLAGGGIFDCFSFAVGLNGSDVKNLKTGYFQNILAMDPKGIKHLVDLYLGIEGVNVSLSDEENLYFDQKTDLALELSNEDHLRLIITDFKEEVKRPWSKAGIWFTEKTKQLVLDKYHNEFNFKEMKGVIASAHSLEFTHRAIDKGVGVQYGLGMFHLPLDQTMAMGDTENDLGMFAVVKHSVAMQNASDIVKKKATDINKYKNSEDGAARYLMDHLEMLDIKE